MSLPNSLPPLLNMVETAKALHVSRRTLYRLVAEHRIRLTKVRGRSFVTQAEIERFLRGAERNGGRAA